MTSNPTGEIAENLRIVRERIAAAAAASGRDAASVALVAVSKTKSVEMMKSALVAGQLDFGENYAQEAAEKIKALPAVRFHFIGSLQTNKVKLVAGRVSLIHSVDRLKLAREISRIAVEQSLVQDILVQLQIGDEATKSGASFAEALEMVEGAESLSGLRFAGVMSLPPLASDEAISRGYFRETREAFERLRAVLPSGKAAVFKHLSMGTTGDFEAAIAEGATLVRVGTAIFGKREF